MSASGMSVQAATHVRPARETLRRLGVLLAAAVAIAVSVASVAIADSGAPARVVCTALVICWAAAGVVVDRRRPTERLGGAAVAAAALIAITMLLDASDQHTLRRAALGIITAAVLHLLAALPDGTLLTSGRRWAVGVAYVCGLAVGLASPEHASGPVLWPFVLAATLAVVAGPLASSRRYRESPAADQRRMQWVGWALAMVTQITLAVTALRLLVSWPPHAAVVVLAATALLPLSLAAGSHDRLVARVDRLLTGTVASAGLTALVIGAYVAVVALYGRSVSSDERHLLLLSMGAAFVAAAAFIPLRTRLGHAANQIVYGERNAPDDALRTWGNRLTRAIPLDELLLQLAESLRKSMAVASAEIYTGADGTYELAAGVPHRSVDALVLGQKETQVVARSGVSGGTWLDIWMPRLAPTNSANTRVAPIVHGGSLLGLIVLTRHPQAAAPTADDDRVLTELARQIGLALHNVQLDSALQASLDALQQTNADLVESRRRIVSAGDAERRKLERNLHDGAQQHLVAMAVKLRLAEELIEDDPIAAAQVIEELRGSLKDAIAELRALAHGIFPPLLSSGGLREALPAAAARAALDAVVDTSRTGRYSPEVESTVYFCCLEALQNAAKYAGDGAHVEVSVQEDDARLTFEVRDDGVGFDADDTDVVGHGFVNMFDRVGTVRGRLTVTSAPGAGTTIRGEIPLG